jgi:hypothetical protein
LLPISRIKKIVNKSNEKTKRIFYIHSTFKVTLIVGGNNLRKGANMPEMLRFAQTFFLEILFPVFA